MTDELVKIYDEFETDDYKRQWRDWLRTKIAKGVVEVTFQKKDGSVRVMKGTTNVTSIPETENVGEGKPQKERKYNPDQICVIYDLEANGWRSFNFDSVIGVQTDIDHKQLDVVVKGE